MTYSLDQFQQHLHSQFTIQFANQQQVHLTLDEVRVPTGDKSHYQHFSLFFLCQGTLQLQQGSYPLSHPVLPEQFIFLVPVANKNDTYCYQAVFNLEK